MSSQLTLRAKYCEKIEAAIAERHIVKFSVDSQDDATPKHYLQHFNTLQTKVRVVYDAARKSSGTSLYGLMARGPIFMQSM